MNKYINEQKGMEWITWKEWMNSQTEWIEHIKKMYENCKTERQKKIAVEIPFTLYFYSIVHTLTD